MNLKISMHLKITKTRYKGKISRYGKIIETYRENGKIKQKIIRNIGNIKTNEDEKRAEGLLNSLQSGEKLISINEINYENFLEYGMIYVTEKLLEKYGIKRCLGVMNGKERIDIVKIITLLIANRLYRPSSDLDVVEWINEEAYADIKVQPQHIYRTLDKLIKYKGTIEKSLFEELKKNCKLNLKIALYDLTSAYFEGNGSESADYGYSRDHRRDRKQIVIGLVMCDGIPIMHEIFEGNTVDKITLKEMVNKLKQRLGLKTPIFVADRGLITENNIETLNEEEYNYILGCPRRNNNVSEELLIKEVKTSEKQDSIEVKKEEYEFKNRKYQRRYILCIDKNTRKERLYKLQDMISDTEKKLKELQTAYIKSQESKKGKKISRDSLMLKASKILGKNKRLFNIEFDNGLKFSPNKENLEYEKQIAGKFLLVTNTDLDSKKVMKTYKDLKEVENAFRNLKSFVKLRPIYHWKDRRVNAHIFVCVQSFLIKCLIKKAVKSLKISPGKAIRKINRIKVANIKIEDEEYLFTNKLNKEQKAIFSALQIVIPPKTIPQNL